MIQSRGVYNLQRYEKYEKFVLFFYIYYKDLALVLLSSFKIEMNVM